jgi:hypothetical protein
MPIAVKLVVVTRYLGRTELGFGDRYLLLSQTLLANPMSIFHQIALHYDGIIHRLFFKTQRKIQIQGAQSMKPTPFFLSLMGFSLLAACAANAQATRTWVSGVGDDANPCSRTAPCKTFAGAISKTAAGGEIDALDPGGFGTVTITKSITLDGGGGIVASILAGGTSGININAATTDVVTIRNLSITGIRQSTSPGTNGIVLNTAGALHIESCRIFGFATNGISITPSSMPTAGSQVIIDDTVVQNNGAAGLQITGNAADVHVSVYNSRFTGNVNGVVAADFSRVAISHSDASGNSSVGFLAQAANGNTTMNIAESNAANNLVAGVQAGGAAANSIMRLSNVSLLANTTGMTTGTNGSIISYGNNTNANGGTPNTTEPLQ